MNYILFGLAAIKGVIADVEKCVNETDLHIKDIERLQKEAAKTIKIICDGIEKEK